MKCSCVTQGKVEPFSGSRSKEAIEKARKRKSVIAREKAVSFHKFSATEGLQGLAKTG